MPESKDMAGKDEERQVRGRPGTRSQAKAEKNRSTSRKGAAGAAKKRTVPKLGKHDSSRGDTSGDGLH